MYELVITTGYDFKNYKVLKTGTYGEICQVTSMMDGTDDIRKKYQSDIDDFLKHEQGNGSIVVLKHPDLDHPQDIEPCRVIYKSDKKIFNKLLDIPAKSDSIYPEWINFWNYLRTQSYWKKFIPNSQDSINKNEKIDKYSDIMGGCRYRFNNILNALSPYLKDNFYPLSNGFSRYVFPNFKRKIKQKGYENTYYEFAAIVLKAFDCYTKLYNMYKTNGKEIFERYNKLKNSQKNVIGIDLKQKQNIESANDDVVIKEIFASDDIYDQHNVEHSLEYISLKYAIDNRDADTIKQFIDKYGFNGFQEEEIQEIKFIIDQDNVYKKR